MDRSRKQEKEKDVKDAAWDLMEEIYLYVSDNGSLPAHARQMMYRARKLIQEATGIAEPWKKSSDFTQTLLPDFMADQPDTTRNWDVVYDARGHVSEPPYGQAGWPGHLGGPRVRHVSSDNCFPFQRQGSFPDGTTRYRVFSDN